MRLRRIGAFHLCRINSSGGVQRDQIVFLYKVARAGQRDLLLRRIEFRDERHQRTLVFLAHHCHFAASTIARLRSRRRTPILARNSDGANEAALQLASRN